MKKSQQSSNAPLKVVGHAATRVDAREKVTGTAEFSADRPLPGAILYGKTLRSPYPHTEIVGIDTTKAEALAGVRTIISYQDAPDIPFEAGGTAPDGAKAPVYVLNCVFR